MRLEPQEILVTARRLHARIEARFPQAGLLRISREVVTLADEAGAGAETLGAPSLTLRAVSGLLFAAMIYAVYRAYVSIHVDSEVRTITDLVTTLEAGANCLIIFGGAAYFVFSLETHFGRRRVLSTLHRLRSVAHIIDLHQLTKDPAWDPAKRTSASPPVHLDGYSLIRYLDYCSELLSLVSKISALYAQNFADPVVLNAVDEIEELTIGMSQKIWVKITVAAVSDPSGSVLPEELVSV